MSTTTLDPAELASMSKGKVLVCRPAGRAWVCAICGCPLDAGDWQVTLPGGRKAQPGCAGDYGWGVT